MKKVTARNVYPLFLAKHFVPTKVGQLLEDPTLRDQGVPTIFIIHLQNFVSGL